jgi:hypothetical protein
LKAGAPESSGAATPAPTKGLAAPTPDTAPTSEESPSSPENASGATTAQIIAFTPKEFKKWAQANPEEALAFREAIDKDSFRLGEDTKAEWIRQTQRGRKLREEIRTKREELDREMGGREAKAKEQLQLAETTAQSIRYLSEMWGAANGKDATGNRVIDFDAVEEAFRQNTGGLSINDFVKLAARRGVANPEAARLRAELRRAELELEKNKGAAAPAQPTNGAGAVSGTAQPEAAAPAPAVSPGLHANPEEYWGDEVPADHPLRRLAGWGQLLDRAMLQWHDDVLDEYSRDAEDIASEIFQRQLAALTGGAEAGPEKVAVKPHARAKPATPKNRQAAIRKTASDDGAPAVSVPGLGIPAHKLVPRGQVNTDRSHYVVPQEKWGDVARQTGGIEHVTRSAIERAKLRAQGIDPDTGGTWEG